MDNLNSIFHRGLLIILIIDLSLLLTGCQGPVEKELKQEPEKKIFYPAPPDKPRLQFLKSISKEEDLGAIERKKSGFEKFVLGGVENIAKDAIGKPYGVTIYEGKLYICDVQKKLVEELDLKEKTFGYLTKERRMVNPVNICIVKGRKYVADPIGGQVFVFDKDNKLTSILGRDLKLKPIDISISGKRCYVTDMNSNQVVVLDILNDKEIMRIGKPGPGDGQFGLIGDIALDKEENIYVTDKAFAKITKFDRNGIFQKTIGKVGESIHDFIRPKGIDVDREGRIWVVDAAPEVAKIYNSEGQLLMFFGFPGNEPGNMNMPASIIIDYDNVELFKEYFAEGAQIEFLVLVSNQYGEKINVYGFGSFPVQEKAIEEEARKLELELQEDAKRLESEIQSQGEEKIQKELKTEEKPRQP